MSLDHFQPTDLWRTIILYGRNTATYKLALAQCLSTFTQHDQTHVSIQDLAQAFFDLYVERLKGGKPQLLSPARQTVMERIVDRYTLGLLDRAGAIDRVAREAFDDVIPRFHTVNDAPLPVTFYEHTPQGLILTDHVFDVFTPADRHVLLSEIASRWDLLEGAFLKRRDQSELANDIRRFYLRRGYDRTTLTGLVPVLRGYQDDRCFYCSELFGTQDIEVDHVIPRQVVQHDEVWNLVLAHRFCNGQKQDALPDADALTKLIERNERFIVSNHPLHEQLVQTLGRTPAQRRQHVLKVYADAQVIIPYTWQGIKGYHAATDPFYRAFVRSITT